MHNQLQAVARVICAAIIPITATRTALAQEGKRDKGKNTVEVQVWAIRATAANNEISPELKGLAETLAKQFKFKGYKLVKSQTKTLPMGDSTTAPLIDPFKVQVTPQKKKDDGKIELKVQVVERKGDKDEKKPETTISLAPGKFQLFGGWSLDKGDTLIMAVSAK